MEKSVKSTALNYGLYLGLFLTVVTVLIYAVNLELFIKWWLGIILLIVSLIIGIMASVKARKLLGGFISFKNAFTTFFITMAVGSLIATVVSIVIFTFVDPEAAQQLNEQILVLTKETMERFGAPQENITEAIEKARETDNFSIVSQMTGWVWRLLIYAILGLIVAVIVKRNDPEQA